MLKTIWQHSRLVKEPDKIINIPDCFIDNVVHFPETEWFTYLVLNELEIEAKNVIQDSIMLLL